MSFKTASAILRGGWLIQKGFVQNNVDLILNMRKGQAVDFGLSEKEEEELKATLNLCGVSMASSTRYYQVGMYSSFDTVQDNSIAVVNLLGPVLKYGDMCSYGMVDKAQLLQRVAASGKFKSIILNVDSPGGQADGTQLLADTIKNIQEYFGIPVIAVVDDGMMASAAMWIGSACAEIYATKATDTFGSIGVYMTLMDFRKYLEEMGIEMRDVYADQSTDKNKSYRDALDGDDALLKEQLNFLAATFISAVQENRGDRLNTENENPFTGKMYPAQQAADIGLIDGILPFDEILVRADTLGSSLTTNPTNQNPMFGNKFSALSALAGVAVASITAAQMDAVNKQIEAANIQGITAVLDSELETASAAATANESALAAINAVLGEGNHKPNLAEAVSALVAANADAKTDLVNMTADRDKHKADAVKYGALAGDEPTKGTQEQTDEIQDSANANAQNVFYSQADSELAALKAKRVKLPGKK